MSIVQRDASVRTESLGAGGQAVPRPLNICVDLDETLCYLRPGDGTSGGPASRDYGLAEPLESNIRRVNELYDQGHRIVIWTARGTATGIDWSAVTRGQLEAWGVKHHELRLGKPAYDVLIDDKALNPALNWDRIGWRTVLEAVPRHFGSFGQPACALIPARYGSSRLRGKPLLRIGGKTVIQRTYEQALAARTIDRVYVVTDHEEIASHVREFGGEAIMVTEECANGTERIARALSQVPERYQTIVNVQGDEPFIDPSHIDLIVERHRSRRRLDVVCTTLHTTCQDDPEDRGLGKLVLDQEGHIMYCSRAVIPHQKSGRTEPANEYLVHVGVFVFDRHFLPQYLSNPSTRSQAREDIEWLKIMEMGYRVQSHEVPQSERGVNTWEDYLHLLRLYDPASGHLTNFGATDIRCIATSAKQDS